GGHAFAYGEEFDDEALIAGGLDHLGGHAFDAFDVDIVDRHGRVEGQRRQDRGFRGRIVSADVGGRIGFGIAERLSGGQGPLEVPALGIHLVEDVVRGAVDDADDPLDPVTGQRVADRADDGDGSGHGRFVLEADTGGVGGGHELTVAGG